MSIIIPNNCIRDRKDCCSLALIKSDCGKSFWCFGHNDEDSRQVKADRFRLCFKNETMDEMDDLDDADVKDLMSVLAQGMSADEHMKRDT